MGGCKLEAVWKTWTLNLLQTSLYTMEICYACDPREWIRIFLCLSYGFSISGEGVSNFSDKYFVLVLCLFSAKQFHLFQNYTERASSLITALDKKLDSGISDNATNRKTASASELLLRLSAAVTEHWTGQDICLWTRWERKIRVSVQHTARKLCCVISQHYQRHCSREVCTSVSIVLLIISIPAFSEVTKELTLPLQTQQTFLLVRGCIL